MLACFCAKIGRLQVPSTKLDISNGKGILFPECVTIRFCSVVEMISPKSWTLHVGYSAQTHVGYSAQKHVAAVIWYDSCDWLDTETQDKVPSYRNYHLDLKTIEDDVDNSENVISAFKQSSLRDSKSSHA